MISLKHLPTPPSLEELSVQPDLARLRFPGQERPVVEARQLSERRIFNGDYFRLERIDGYDVYLEERLSTADKAAYLPAVKEMLKGVQRAEQLYGFAAGERMKDIFVVKSPLISATPMMGVRNGIREAGYLVTTGTLTAAPAPWIVGFHEGVHGFPLSPSEGRSPLESGEFDEVVEGVRKRNPDFFPELNEKRFLSPQGIGGHTEQGLGEEVYASMVTSLLHPDWLCKMQSMPKGFVDDYILILTALRKVIAEHGPAIGDLKGENPAILALIDERLKSLK